MRTKRILYVSLILAMFIFSLSITVFGANNVVATPTVSKVIVDGKLKSFDAYNIEDSNYFKLRDIAFVLSGTIKQFDVTWDNTKNAINLISGKPYTVLGGEMNKSSSTKIKTAMSTTSKIYLDGKEIMLTAYNIDGNNYFKLRDLGNKIGFGVEWNSVTNEIGISVSPNLSNSSKLMRVNCYGVDGSLLSWVEYKYDTNGVEVEKIEYHGDGVIRFWDESYYDAKGNKIKIINYEGPGLYLSGGYDSTIKREGCWYDLQYDANGNNIKTTQYYKDTIISWTDYKYDANGNKVKSNYYKANNGKMVQEYRFDADRNQFKLIFFDDDGEISGTQGIKYQYDAKGKLIKEIIYGSDGDMIHWYEYKYNTD